MTSRFHNKFHKDNHHTSPIPNDPDSGNDPIASSDRPFVGDFNMNGVLDTTKGATISGNIYLGGDYSKISATESIDGVVRIATDSEAISREYVLAAVTPHQLGLLDVEVETLNPPHNLLSDAHTDTTKTGVIDDFDVFTFNGSKWTNQAHYLGVGFATDEEAEQGVVTDKAVTAAQALTEIARNRPRRTVNNSVLPELGPNQAGVLAFEYLSYYGEYRTSNGTASSKMMKMAVVYKWNGVSWDQLNQSAPH